jgi:hypothetical protein
MQPMRNPSDAWRSTIAVLALLAAVAVAALGLAACGAGLPPGDSRVVEGEEGWYLAVPDGVAESSRVKLWVATDTTDERVMVNLEIAPAEGGRNTEFAQMWLPGGGDWISIHNRHPLSPGEFAVKITAREDRATLVQADIVVDHDEEPSPFDWYSHRPDFGLEEARQFDEFSLYWLGDEFQGMPLRKLSKLESQGVPSLDGKTRSPPYRIVVFSYGDCRIPAGAQACPIPLSLNISPYCETPPEVIRSDSPFRDIRGAQAHGAGGAMSLWTRDVHISISGTDAAMVEAAVRNLVSLTPGGPVSAAEDLGPPFDVDCPPRPHFNRSSAP